MYVCEQCGETVMDGGWPFCKGGHGKPGFVAISDSYRGGKTIFNLGHTPVVVHSNSERLRIAKQRGLHEHVEHTGGQYTSRWV